MSLVTKKKMDEWGYTEDGKGGWLRVEKSVRNVKGKQSSMDLDVPADPRTYQGTMWNGYIFIPYNVISLKNSKDIAFRPTPDGKPKSYAGVVSFRKYKSGKTGYVMPFVMNNKPSMEYVKNTAAAYQTQRQNFLDMIKGKDKPLFVEMIFVRKTRATFDFHNMIQIVADCMQDHQWIPEDDVENLLIVPPMDGRKCYIHNPKHPGVLIKVL